MKEHRLRREVGVVQRRTVPIAVERKLSPVQPRTMVEQAAEAIVNAAARGIFLPGDRLIEAEIARELTISRVPVREALRLLESHGVVVNTPYKGMRLMELGNERLRALNAVRKVLEPMAAREARQATQARDAWQPLRAIVSDMRSAADAQDVPRVMQLDIAFHTELFQRSGNAVLIGLWQSLARQAMIMFALSYRPNDLAGTARKHGAIADALASGDEAALERAWAAHFGWLDEFDAEAALAAMRKPRRGR